MAAKKAGEYIVKQSTGLTGLVVAPNPHHSLNNLYGKIMRACAKMPQDAAYRKYTEQIVTERMRYVETEPTPAGLEKKINCGQIEEVIIQAENELILARKMLEWKPWEPLKTLPSPNQWKWPI